MIVEETASMQPVASSPPGSEHDQDHEPTGVELSGWLDPEPRRIQFAVNPHLKIVPCGRNEILVKHGTRSPYSEVLRDEGRTGLMGRVLDALDEPASLTQLLEAGVVDEAEIEQTSELFTELVGRNILIDPTKSLSGVYLSTFLSQNGDAGALATATIGMVGCGQLGTKIAEELYRLRPASMVLLDPRAGASADVVYSGGSTNGQGRSGSNDQGLKAALSSRFPDGPELDVISSESGLDDDVALGSICERADLVVVALETHSPSTLHAMNEMAIAHRTSWMSVFFDGSEAVIGPTYVPAETCCYHEFETQSQASMRYKAEYLVFKEFLRNTSLDNEVFTLPPFASVAAGFTATSALHYLVRGKSFTSGRVMRINFETLSIDMHDVLRLPRCPACRGARPTYRNLFL